MLQMIMRRPGRASMLNRNVLADVVLEQSACQALVQEPWS